MKKHMTMRYKMRNLFEQKQKHSSHRYKIIGIELKRKRISLSKTLQTVSDSICSPSYLCKIENNDINPNLQFLEQICSRVHLSMENLDDLMNLEEITLQMVSAFFSKNSILIDQIYEKVVDFSNYCAEIIMLIYYLYYEDYDNAMNLSFKMNKYIELVNDFGLKVYCVFFGILQYKTEYLLEGYENLTSSIMGYKNDYLDILAMEYRLYCMFRFNSKKAIELYHEVIAQVLLMQSYEKVVEIQFHFLSFLFKNHYLEEAFKIIQFYQGKEKADFLVMYYIEKQDYIKAKELYFNTHFTNPCIYCYASCLFNFEKAADIIQNQIEKVKKADYQFIFLKYLEYKFGEDEHFFQFLIDTAIPYSINTFDHYFAKVYAKELFPYFKEKGIYKQGVLLWEKIMELEESLHGL